MFYNAPCFLLPRPPSWGWTRSGQGALLTQYKPAIRDWKAKLIIPSHSEYHTLNYSQILLITRIEAALLSDHIDFWL